MIRPYSLECAISSLRLQQNIQFHRFVGRLFAAAGGLIDYSASLSDAFRLASMSAGFSAAPDPRIVQSSRKAN
jgi:hypothetical protein